MEAGAAMSRIFRVEAEFDHEVGVWYVSGSDVPGLATEASSLDELMAKLQVMIPDLFDARAECGLESAKIREGDVSIEFIDRPRAVLFPTAEAPN